MGNLTVKQIENAKPKDKPYKLMDGDGPQPWQIREQTGHTSDVTLAKYIRALAKRAIPSLL